MNWYLELKYAGVQPMDFRDIQRAMAASGYQLTSSNGPHHKFCNQRGHCVPIPKQRQISPGVVRNLTRMIGTDLNQFMQMAG